MRNLSLPFLLPLGHGLEGLLHQVLQLIDEAGGKPVALAHAYCLQSYTIIWVFGKKREKKMEQYQRTAPCRKKITF